LSLPHRLRYLLAWDHDLCRAVSGVAVRAVLGFLRRRAGRAGVDDGRSGAVVVVQRFGGALNLNIHLHALVLDGVFTNDGGVVPFHPVRRLTREDVAEVVALVARRVTRVVERRGLAGRAEDGEASDPWSDEAPVLAAVAAASVEGRAALGPRAGARVRKCGDPPEEVMPVTLRPCHAHAGGFDLHAGLVVRAGQRDRLERVCRYALRTPLAQERLHQTSEGEIWLTLRRRWADGTTHLRFDPLELLERLAVLTPRPRVNLILYYGVLAPRAAWRAALVAGTSHGVSISQPESSEGDEDTNRAGPSRPGAYQGRPRCRRIRCTTAACSIRATRRSRPPQRGHARTSSANVRRINSAYIAEFLRVLAPRGVLMFQLPEEFGTEPEESFLNAPVVGSALKKRLPRLLVSAYRQVKYWLIVDKSLKRMAMFGMPQDVVLSVIREAGGRVLAVTPDQSHGPTPRGYEYWVSR
jgi:hypothetical protein